MAKNQRDIVPPLIFIIGGIFFASGVVFTIGIFLLIYEFGTRN